MFRFIALILPLLIVHDLVAEYSFGLSAIGELDNVDPIVTIQVQPPDTVQAETSFSIEYLTEDQGVSDLTAELWQVDAGQGDILIDSLTISAGLHTADLQLPEGVFTIRIVLKDTFGNTGQVVSEEVVSLEATSVAQDAALPRVFSMSPAHPNPFNPTTTISYHLPAPGDVTLRVASITGAEVHKEYLGFQQAGNHRAMFSGSELSSGLYFIHMTWKHEMEVQKVMLIK